MTGPTFQQQMPSSTRVVRIVYKLLGRRFGAFTSLVNPGYIWETLQTLLVSALIHKQVIFKNTLFTNHFVVIASLECIVCTYTPTIHQLQLDNGHKCLTFSTLVLSVTLLLIQLLFKQLIQKPSWLGKVEPDHLKTGTSYYWFVCLFCIVDLPSLSNSGQLRRCSVAAGAIPEG